MLNTTDIASRIAQLKSVHERAKEDRLRAEQDLKNTEEKLAELERQCREIGVEPNKLEDEIGKTEQKLNDLLTSIESQIPTEYRNQTGGMSGYGVRMQPDYSSFGR